MGQIELACPSLRRLFSQYDAATSIFYGRDSKFTNVSRVIKLQTNFDRVFLINLATTEGNCLLCISYRSSRANGFEHMRHNTYFNEQKFLKTMQHSLQHHIYDPRSVSLSHKIPVKDIIVYG